MRRPAVVGIVLIAALAGCAGTAQPGAEPGGSSPEAEAAPTARPTLTPEPPADYPQTVQNCGVEVTVEAPPVRIVTIKSSATELVLALGAGDRLVGTAFSDGPVPDALALDADDVPVLSEKVPAAEVVLGTEPDLVYAGWESNLTAEAAGDRATLAGLGVATYVSPSACKDPAHRPGKLTFEEVFDEIGEIAQLLGVPAQADAIITEQRAALGEIVPATGSPTVLWFSSGSDVPYVGAGIGAPQMLMEAVGLENIAGAIQDTWSAFSWEQVAQDDPDVIVLVDAAWNTAEQKRALLATNPATANLTAVLNERYLVVPFAASEAGVRNVPAATDLADQLADLSLG